MEVQSRPSIPSQTARSGLVFGASGWSKRWPFGRDVRRTWRGNDGRSHSTNKCRVQRWRRWCSSKKSRWWFQTIFVFTPIWGRFPFCLIVFSDGLESPTRNVYLDVQFVPLWNKPPLIFFLGTFQWLCYSLSECAASTFVSYSSELSERGLFVFVFCSRS